MDITSLYYFSELAKDLHMTRTANRLFISQQTLSNHIQRLEDYYGVQLLYRKPSLSLTSAGEFVLAFANIVNKEEINLKDILSDVEKQERGAIRFGASSLRLNAILPEILPEFSVRYPHVEVRITDNISSRLYPKVLEGELDFAICTSQEFDSRLLAWHLMTDQTYLCVRDDLLKKVYGEQKGESIKAKAFKGAHVSDFAEIPFCMLTNGVGKAVMQCFEEEKIHPQTLVSSSDTRIGVTMANKGIVACFVPQMRLVSMQERLPSDLNIFPLCDADGKKITQEFSLVRHKERYLSHYSKSFLDLLFRYTSQMEETHMERIAGAAE